MALPGMTQLNDAPPSGPLSEAELDRSVAEHFPGRAEAPEAAHPCSEFLEDDDGQPEPGDGIQRGLFGWQPLVVAAIAAFVVARCTGIVG